MQITDKNQPAANWVGAREAWEAILDESSVATFDSKRGLAAWNAKEKKGLIEPAAFASTLVRLFSRTSATPAQTAFLGFLETSITAQAASTAYAAVIIDGKYTESELLVFKAVAQMALLEGIGTYIIESQGQGSALGEVAELARAKNLQMVIKKMILTAYSPDDLNERIITTHRSVLTLALFESAMTLGKELVSNFLKEVAYTGALASISEDKVQTQWIAACQAIATRLPFIFHDIVKSREAVAKAYVSAQKYMAAYRYMRAPSSDITKFDLNIENNVLKAAITSGSVMRKVPFYIPFGALMTGYRIGADSKLGPLVSNPSFSDLLFESYLPSEQALTTVVTTATDVADMAAEEFMPLGSRFETSHVEALVSGDRAAFGSVLADMAVSCVQGAEYKLFAIDKTISPNTLTSIADLELNRQMALLDNSFSGYIFGNEFNVNLINGDLAIRYVAAQLLAACIPYRATSHAVTIEVVNVFPVAITMSDFVLQAGSKQVNVGTDMIKRVTREILKLDPSFVPDRGGNYILGEDLYRYYAAMFDSLGGDSIQTALGLNVGTTQIEVTYANMVMGWLAGPSDPSYGKALVLSGAKRRDALIASQHIAALFQGASNADVKVLLAMALSLYLSSQRGAGSFTALADWLEALI